MKVYSRGIYKMHEPYDEEAPEFNCIRPAETNSYNLFDAWICDEQGRVHPGYNVSPVPILKDSFNPTPLHELENQP